MTSGIVGVYGPYIVHPRALSKVVKSVGEREESVVIVWVIVNCAERTSVELFFGSEQLRMVAATSGFEDAGDGSCVTFTGALSPPTTVGTDD